MSKIEDIIQDIKSMRIRGANLIARSAALGLRITAEKSKALSTEEFMINLEATAKRLLSTRPTAVSLPNAVKYVMQKAKQSCVIHDVEVLRNAVINAADSFIENAEKATKMIGEIGARRVRDGDVLLTHCNSSAALAVIKTAWKQGKKLQVLVTESRPRYQGRLSARRLVEDGIPTTLIVDSAARFFMKDIDMVIVGADAVSVNGAVVNKIGTSLIALAAHEARTLFSVAAETFKFSPETIVGELIDIEERDNSEILPRNVDIKGIKVRNPAFDITPPDYIDLIITEKGIIPPQYAIEILRQEFGNIIGEE